MDSASIIGPQNANSFRGVLCIRRPYMPKPIQAYVTVILVLGVYGGQLNLQECMYS